MYAKKLLLSVLILGSLYGTGCVLRHKTVLARFGGEFICPESQIKVEQFPNSKDMFKATGCNRRANYKCSGDYGEFCERIGQPESIQPETGIIDQTGPSVQQPTKEAQ